MDKKNTGAIEQVYESLKQKYKDNEWALELIREFEDDLTTVLKAARSLIWTLDIYD